jgi:hypothetical protein
VQELFEGASSISELTSKAGMAPEDAARLLEVAFARCIEARQVAHYSAFTRDEFLVGENDEIGTMKVHSLPLPRSYPVNNHAYINSPTTSSHP